MLNKGALISAIESAFRSAEPGQDSVAQLASSLADAIDTYVKSGTVKVNTIGGACAYTSNHPPLHSEGLIT